MSFVPDNGDHQRTVEELLESIEKKLMVIAARLESAFETGLDEGDVDDDDY